MRLCEKIRRRRKSVADRLKYVEMPRLGGNSESDGDEEQLKVGCTAKTLMRLLQLMKKLRSSEWK